MFENVYSYLLLYILTIVGVVVRTILPYAQKQAEGQNLPFDTRYAWSAFISAIAALSELMTLSFITYQASNIDPFNILPPMAAAIVGFLFGLGNNEIINRLIPGSELSSTATTTSPPVPPTPTVTTAPPVIAAPPVDPPLSDAQKQKLVEAFKAAVSSV